MPRILFLMPTKTYRASAFLSAAQKLNFEIVVGSERKQALAPFTPGKTLTLDFNNPEKAKHTILAFSQVDPLDAIIPVDEDTAVVAALASEALGLPHNSPESARTAREKHRMRESLVKAGLPSPEAQLFSIHEDAREVSRSVVYPCVLKPVFLSSSRGVIRTNDTKEFAHAFKRVSAILQDPEVKTAGRELSQHILVERYIPGDEVALEGIFTESDLRILAIFDKPDPLTGPYFEETIYVTPTRHSEQVQTELADTVVDAARAMGINNGPVHAEIRINARGMWIIEVAARSIGGLCSRALKFNGGITLEELILRHAVGMNIESLKREHLASGVMMIPIPKAGTLKAVHGLAKAKSVRGIEGIKITIPVTQKVVPMPEGNKYLGFIFARDEKAEQVEFSLREAHRRLQFVIE